MERKLILTKDGSSSIYLPDLNEHYHSSHGALQEALHVFIRNGLDQIKSDEIRIFELGFGTGLNALLTFDRALSENKKVKYTGIEAFPIEMELISALNYPDLINSNLVQLFLQMHTSPWDQEVELDSYFTLKKIHAKIQSYAIEENEFDLIYFDAFGFRAQSEMWEASVLSKMFRSLKPGGIMVTYAARGQFKRDLKAIGFEVVSLPGPPGKREMTKAVKPQ